MKTLDDLRRGVESTINQLLSDDESSKGLVGFSPANQLWRQLGASAAISIIFDVLQKSDRIVPDGYVAVPLEPTDEMIKAGELTDELYYSVASVLDVYKAMIAAARKDGV